MTAGAKKPGNANGKMPLGWKFGALILVLLAMTFAGVWLKNKSEASKPAGGAGSSNNTSQPSSLVSQDSQPVSTAARSSQPAAGATAATRASQPAAATTAETSQPTVGAGPVARTSQAAQATPKATQPAAASAATQAQASQPAAAAVTTEKKSSQPAAVGTSKDSSSGGDDTPAFLKPTKSTKRSSFPSVTGSVIRVVIGLGVVILLIVASRALIKKLSPRGRITKDKDGPVEVLSYTGLGNNAGIYTLKVGDRMLLVGSSEHGLNLIQEMSGDALAEMEKAGGENTVRSEFEDTLDSRVAAGTGNATGTSWSGWLDAMRWKTVRR